MTSFGLQLPSFTFDGLGTDGMFERIAETAVVAEASGFDSFWVMDHYHQIGNMGTPTEPMLEAYTTLAGVAARTSRIKLGAMVTGVTYRNPAFLAKVVTTLDVVSAGRAILGIGAAWNEDESRAYGYDWPPVAERFDRLEDAIRICRAMFTQPETSFQGRVHHVAGALNIPQPVQPGGPRILIGGGGERRTMGLVARYADMWNWYMDPDTMRQRIEVLERRCDEVGRDPSGIVKTRLGPIVVSADQTVVQDRLASIKAARGLDEEGLEAMVVWGDPGHVEKGVQRFLDAGLDALIFNMPTGSTPDDVALAGSILTERFGSA